MRIITLNANGLRAAIKKGLIPWLESQKPDVVCLQETKAQEHDMGENFCLLEGYYCYFHDAEKKGYSGVALCCRRKPDRVITGLDWLSAKTEGRYVQADFGDLSVASLYMPSGSSGEERQAVKFDFMHHYYKHLQKIKESQQKMIICGDWNIVHKEIDIKNFKSNQKHSGCLPEERAWLDEVFTQLNFVDAFRVVNHQPEQYTWWSHRGRAWDKNVGWRIDYQILSPALNASVKSVSIYKDQRFSDHAPLIIDYKM